MFGNARFVTGRFCYREASELGEKLGNQPQSPNWLRAWRGQRGFSRIMHSFLWGMMDSVQGHLRQSVLNERVREFSPATRRCTCAIGTFRMYIAEMPLNECEGAIPINRSN